MTKKRNQFLDWLVYAAVRSLVMIIQAMPIEWGYKLADAVAWFGYTVDKRHRKVAIENLRIAFGDRYTEEERRQIAFAVYQHFARVVIEIALIPRRMNEHTWKRFATTDNAAVAVRQIFSGRPTIIVTGHYGNWEMAGYLLAVIGVRASAIARDLDNPYLHRFLLDFRQWSGQTILSKSNDFERIQRVLIERGTLISVGDQSAGPRGAFVDFFGKPASTHKAIALLALQHDADVLVGFGYRDRPGFHYRVGVCRRLAVADYRDRPEAVRTLTQDFTRLLEEVIRCSPEQYLWLHRRWKHEPPMKIRQQAA